jgi:hypothetical protein
MKPPRMPRAKPDGGLTKPVLEYLATQRDVWAERRNSGGQLVKNKDGSYRSILLGEPGTPDITGYLRTVACAVPFAIELKSTTGKLNDHQIAWHGKAHDFGLPVATCRSIGEAKAFIERLRDRFGRAKVAL